MKRFTLALLALSLVSTVIHAVPVLDPFADATGSGGTAYGVGGTLAGNTNAQKRPWTELNTASTGAAVLIGVDNLSFANVAGYSGTLPPSSGNSASFANINARGARMNIAPGGNVTSGSVYASFLLKITNTNSLTTGQWFSGFNNNPATTQSSQPSVCGARIWTKIVNGTGGYQIGTTKASGTSATAVYASPAFQLNETVFVVVNYTFGSTEPSKMWINPDPTSFGAASDPTTGTMVTSTDLTDVTGSPAGIGTWMIMQRSAAQSGGVMDELRISRTWAGVTGAPDIDTQPATQTVNAGTIATFSATAVGVGPLTYQWKKGGNDLSDGGNVSGATIATLTLSNVLQADAADYSVSVTGAFGSTTSTAATLIVTDPSISTQPVSQILPPGANAVFDVVAAGTPTLTYRWQKDGVDLADTGNISGSATASLTLSGISAGDAGSYSVGVTNGLAASVTSAVATLTIVDPAITSQPQGRTNDYGTTATFSVTAAGTGPFSYQWQKGGVAVSDGGNVSGTATANLTLTAVSYLDTGDYSVIVTNAIGGTATSASATLTVIDPILTSQPTAQIKIAGATAMFNVGASGSSLTYTWRKGTATLVDGGNVSGATTAILTLANLAASDAANYSVVVTNTASGQSVTSASVNLAVITPHATRTVNAGNDVIFVTTAAGNGPFTYQWSSNSVPIDGAVLSSLSKNDVQTSDTAEYSVTVGNAVGSVSPAANLVVSATRLRLHSTNIVVLRLGDGLQILGNTGNTLFLDQFTPSGTYVNTVMVPDSGASSLIEAGNSSQEGYMTLSADRRFLTVVGYNVPRPYASSLPAATSALAPRGIGTINGLSLFNLAVSSTAAFNTDNIRCAVTDGTNNFWASGASRNCRYFGPAGQNVQMQSVINNTRVIDIFNDELYYSSAAGSVYGIHKLGNYPTTLATDTYVLPTGNTSSFPADFAVSPDGTIIYVAEDAGAGSNTNAPGVNKFTYDSGSSTWVFSYSIPVGQGLGTRQMTADFSANPPKIYAVTCIATNATASTANTFVVVEDNGPTSVPTILATAGVNQGFRGVRFAPIVEAPYFGSQPASQTNGVGRTATLSTVVYGTDPRTYQWLKNNSPLANGANISGADTATLTLANLTTDDAGTYTLSVTNDLGSITSSGAVLTMVQPPVITADPQSVTNTAGDTVTFNVSATGPGSLTYQWRKGGSNLADGGNISGTATDTLSLTNITLADAAGYDAVVGYSGVNSTSLVAMLTVLLPQPGIQPIVGAGTTNVTVSWGAIVGGSYELQYKTNLNDATWTSITTVVATNTPVSVIDVTPEGDPKRFYRVLGQ